MFDTVLFSVIQPGTYIIKTRQVKDILANLGWCNTLRQFCNLGNNQVSPTEAIEMKAIDNENDRHQAWHERPQPIRTISENVENRKQ